MKKIILALLLTYAAVSFSQNLYDIKPFKGYLVSATYNKNGQWPISFEFMCNSLEFINSSNNVSTNKIIDNIVDSTYIVPIEIMQNLSLFEYFLNENDKELLQYTQEYTDIYRKLFSRHRKKGSIIFKDSSILNYEYAKYYGFILCPKRDSKIYKTKIVCGSIDYSEYPNIKLCLPIVSGFIK